MREVGTSNAFRDKVRNRDELNNRCEDWDGEEDCRGAEPGTNWKSVHFTV